MFYCKWYFIVYFRDYVVILLEIDESIVKCMIFGLNKQQQEQQEKV
jgi:hypothetical protein